MDYGEGFVICVIVFSEYCDFVEEIVKIFNIYRLLIKVSVFVG